MVLSGGRFSKTAKAKAVVSNGRIVAIEVLNGGKSYATAPTVAVGGGQAAGSGPPAKAVAHIANGEVTFMSVTDPGSGYVEPLSVVISPGKGALNVIPIWGAAGSISTDLTDMGRFMAAALGHRRIDGIPVPSVITSGFRVAEAAYACTGPDPSLANCPPSRPRSALTWTIEPADPANHYPSVIAKNGSLPGFNTQVFLVPDRDIAVTVFVSSRETENTATPAGGKGLTATTIARNILNALLFEHEVR